MINRLFKPAALCCAVAALAGCAVSPIPLAENFPLTVQKKVRSAGHWNLLSHDVVEQTVASLEKSGATTQSTIRVPMPANASDFDLAFHEFLITELVKKGWIVLMPANNSIAALTLDYQTQIVNHSGLDYVSSVNTGGPTHTELLLTTTVSGAGRYISRKTDVYYVEESDTSLFANLYSNPATLHARTMKVVAE